MVVSGVQIEEEVDTGVESRAIRFNEPLRSMLSLAALQENASHC